MNPTSVRPGNCLGLAAVILFSFQFIGSSMAAGEPGSTRAEERSAKLPAKPQVREDKRGGPTHGVNEGGAVQPLWLDTGRVVEFNRPGASQPVLRPPQPGEGGDRAGKAQTGGSGAGQVSPVFLDAAGQPRALPGGVIVSLRETVPEAQAIARLEAAGLSPVRQLGERTWLVDAPAGTPSLELANRLQADGRFESVQANWWRPRTTK